MKKIAFNVKGMHCKSCEALVIDELDGLGVESISADHKTGSVKVTYDESIVSLSSIKAAIKELGYEVA